MVEYLETHSFLVKPDELLCAVEEQGVEGIQTSVMTRLQYNDKYNSGPDLGRFNSYAFVSTKYTVYLKGQEARLGWTVRIPTR